MVNYFIFTIFIIFFTFLEQFSKKVKNGLLLSFFLIFIAIAVRYDFGSDYLMYEREFKIINSVEPKLWPFGMTRLEEGWVYLNKLFGFAGFNYLIIFLSFIYGLVFYFFIKKTLDKKLYGISVVFFLLVPGIFILHQSLLRQTIALLLFLLAIMLVEKKGVLIWSVLILFAASFFHFSALLLIPVLFTKYLNLTKKQAYFIGCFYIILFFIGYSTYLTTSIFKVIDYIFPKYSYYLDPARNNKIKLNSGLGIAFSSANFFLILYFKDKFLQKESIRIIYFSTVIFYLITPLFLSISISY
jgi:hypothetical protein